MRNLLIFSLSLAVLTAASAAYGATRPIIVIDAEAVEYQDGSLRLVDAAGKALFYREANGDLTGGRLTREAAIELIEQTPPGSVAKAMLVIPGGEQQNETTEFVYTLPKQGRIEDGRLIFEGVEVQKTSSTGSGLTRILLSVPEPAVIDGSDVVFEAVTRRGEEAPFSAGHCSFFIDLQGDSFDRLASASGYEGTRSLDQVRENLRASGQRIAEVLRTEGQRIRFALQDAEVDLDTSIRQIRQDVEARLQDPDSRLRQEWEALEADWQALRERAKDSEALNEAKGQIREAALRIRDRYAALRDDLRAQARDSETARDTRQVEGDWPEGGWTLVELHGKAVEEERRPTLTIAENGEVNGFAGVNRYRGRLEEPGSQALFGPLAATRMAGPPEAMELEDAFFDALSAAVSYRIAGNKLTLYDGEGREVAVLES